MNQEIIEKFAKLAVESGVNLKSGQELLVITAPEARALTLAVVKKAYERGAKRVHVQYRDTELKKLDFQFQTVDTLTNKPQFIYDERNYFADQNGCVLNIICEDPTAYEHLDSQKLIESSRADSKGFDPYYKKALTSRIKWSIIAYPHPAWAKKMFPNLTESVAMKKLGEIICTASRADGDNPIQTWKEHSTKLAQRCKALNDCHFTALHYQNALGTDLKLGLPKNYVFAGGAERCTDGTYFNANIPSEEVFSAPDCRRIEGTVVASMPLCHNGKLIEGMRLIFQNGRVTDYSADTNREVLKGIIETDEGSKTLGEVALVPYDSPISQLNTLFYETLFDENASCHLALGRAYASCVAGGDAMSEEQLKKIGINATSYEHVDFMIGTRDLSIVGITQSGETIPVFENGNFTERFDQSCSSVT